MSIYRISDPDLAYRMLTQSEPGYKTWYEYGATTLFEKWEGGDIHSHSHHMFSNVLGRFFKSLLGFVRGYEDTVRGRIAAEWKYEDGGFRYTVTIPEGVSGEYMGRELTVGENTFFVKYCEGDNKSF